MQITLIRHGRPKLSYPSRIAGHELEIWINRYNSAGVDPELPPPVHLRELAASSGCILCSDLPRSIQSARLLTPADNLIVEDCFREAGIFSPESIGLRFDPRLWGLLARIAWFLGWSPNGESFLEARDRAAAAAERLQEHARRQGSVALVGHRIFNLLLALELRRAGWHGPRWLAGGYWGASTFRRAWE